MAVADPGGGGGANLELPGPLSGPGPMPKVSSVIFALVMCVRAHNLLLPPKKINENPASAPGWRNRKVYTSTVY